MALQVYVDLVEDRSMGWCFGSILGFGLRVSSLLSGYDSRGFGVFRMFRVQVPINSILGFIIRTYKKVRFGSLRYTSN